ncbi:dihydroneopterin aldolase [Catenulispora pinisilvae]|uniref:dihydroneopterin aldolase n=1 Tax=Catenulispora pinisilvae TaxID=2705253 RepID=UPI001E4BB408|nr:dihydroneopterin aldolase [Catenulispora pinisilvae]
MSTHTKRLDRVTVHGLRGRGHHGVFEREREKGQTFMVDVTLGLDTRRAAVSDALSDTVNYGEVSERIVALIEGEPVNLIETLAARMAAMCLEYPLVEEVEVTLHKPDAPITVPFEDVTVTVVRAREDLAGAVGRPPENGGSAI